ncbi:hypothetical protein DFH06DRAFT_318210 [Mycena polygramma]|nr:hypothetical protein DFH06DRAFT_318210 [Mycena polygramma]
MRRSRILEWAVISTISSYVPALAGSPIAFGRFITGLILTPVIAEFHFNGPFLSLAANIGFSWVLSCGVLAQTCTDEKSCSTLLFLSRVSSDWPLEVHLIS